MVFKCDIKKMIEVVKRHYETKTPIFMYGGYGIGKSSIIKQFGQTQSKVEKKEYIYWNDIDETKKKLVEANPEKYFVVFDERLSQYEPSDLRGVPQMFDNNSCVEWKVPRWLNFTTNSTSTGIIFFDELNLASPSIQASAYQIINDRTLSDKRISDGFFIIGAGNRLNDKANVYEMPSPLRDRMSEVELVFNDELWFDWAENKGFDTRILAFLKYKSSNCNRVDDDKESKSATPRGWERCNNQIKGLELSEIEPLVSVAVGEVMGTELVSFVKLSNSIDLNDLLKNPKKIKNVTENSVKYSVCSALAEKYNKENKAIEGIIKIANELDLEFGMLLLRLCKSCNPNHFLKEGVKFKEFLNLAKNYADIMNN